MLEAERMADLMSQQIVELRLRVAAKSRVVGVEDQLTVTGREVIGQHAAVAVDQVGSDADIPRTPMRPLSLPKRPPSSFRS